MQHSEFLADLNTHTRDWEIRSYAAAVRLGFGWRGSLMYFGAHAVSLLPMMVFSGYAVWSDRFVLLAWSALALLGYLAGNPGPTGIGMLWHLVLTAAGIVISLLNSDGTHLIGGVVPGFSWFACCAVYGTTGVYLLARLRESPECFQKLCDARVLIPPARLHRTENADFKS